MILKTKVNTENTDTKMQKALLNISFDSQKNSPIQDGTQKKKANKVMTPHFDELFECVNKNGFQQKFDTSI